MGPQSRSVKVYNPVRILQFCTNFPASGGIQTHVRDLSAWLGAHGHDITFAGVPGASANPQTSPGFISLPMEQISEMKYQSLPLYRRLHALFCAARTLRRALKSNPVDLIHTHETAPALVARLASLGLSIPVLMTFHGSAPERIPSAARIARRCADLTISPSRISLDAMIAHGVDPRKARQLGLGIKPQPPQDPGTVADLRDRYLRGKTGTVIFSPSRLDPQKGIDIMIEVAGRVRARHPDTVFVIAGTGPLDGEVQQWAQAAGQGEAMHFLGSVDTVPLHLAASDIFLLTSRWEALPISIVEAFRAGRPVIATDCGGVRELVDDEVGTLCAVEDVEGLTAAILELIETPDLRASKGQAALARSAEDRFDPDAVHASFAATYAEMIGKTP